MKPLSSRERRVRRQWLSDLRAFVKSPTLGTASVLDSTWAQMRCREKLTCHPRLRKCCCTNCPFTMQVHPEPPDHCFFSEVLIEQSNVAELHLLVTEYLALLKR